MSLSTAYLQNMRVSQDLTLAETVRLSASLEGDMYRVVWPASAPTTGLQILGVSSVSLDEVTLEWLAPSTSLPFDIINCNQLNAVGSGGVAITADANVVITGELLVNEGNITVSNEDIIVSNGNVRINTGQLIAQDATFVGDVVVTSGKFETVGLPGEVNSTTMNSTTNETRNMSIRSDNAVSTNVIKTSDSQVVDVDYVLPTGKPAGDYRFLSSDVNGNMSWARPLTTVVLATNPNVFLNSTTPTITLPIIPGLQPNSTYQLVVYGTVLKTNTGGSFTFDHSINLGANTTTIPTLALATGERLATLTDSSPQTSLGVMCLVNTDITGPFSINLNLDTSISAGGTCTVSEINLVFTSSAN